MLLKEGNYYAIEIDRKLKGSIGAELHTNGELALTSRETSK